MTGATPAVLNLVAANRILANEGVIDAYGHVSIRHPEHPDRYLLARSKSPQFVDVDDIMEFELDGTPVGDDDRPPYLERHIHGALYETRPDFHAAIHAHTESVLPFTVTDVPLRPVVHDASDIGERVPLWDISEKFGDDTDLLVTSMDMGRDLAQNLVDNPVSLMRGHGFAAGGSSLLMTVRMCIYMARNAHVLTTAMALGEVRGLSAGEIRARARFSPDSSAMRRSWDYWLERAGCRDLVTD